MTGMPCLAARAQTVLAVERTISRFSTTHGPAISTRGCPPPIGIFLTVTLTVCPGLLFSLIDEHTKKGGDNQKQALCIRVISGVYLRTMEPQKLTVQACAKINFGLFVTGRRPDGFHDIATVFHQVAVADTIELLPSTDIIIQSDDPAAPSDETNICHRTASLLQEALDTEEGVRCVITKRIPVGAGLGGGSADAGALLKALPAFWKRTADSRTLRALALTLGSDVPFFLGSGSAFATGRGEILEPLPLDVPFAILLCYPNIHVSTAWAYGQIVPRETPPPDLRTLIPRGMKHNRLLREEVTNDFEPAVFAAFPAIGEVKQALQYAGAVFASLSGSGSTVFGLFPDVPAAEAAAREMTAKGYRTFITPPHFAPGRTA
jgi:4-diphosphocytidyl-2-C-methyl-D-erythritol kinase